MSQTFFVWPHGGKSVSLATNFNHWNPQPLVKQGNYFFTVLDLPDGTYQYKYVVDGRWVYDIGQLHEDDGSGNWNNYVEVGKGGEKVQATHHAPAKHEQKHEQKQQQPPKEQHEQKQQQQGKNKGGKKENQQQQQQPKQEKKNNNKKERNNLNPSLNLNLNPNLKLKLTNPNRNPNLRPLLHLQRNLKRKKKLLFL